jgi:hypothetical protein
VARSVADGTEERPSGTIIKQLKRALAGSLRLEPPPASRWIRAYSPAGAQRSTCALWEDTSFIYQDD